MINLTDFKKIGENIYLKKNFLSIQDIDILLKECYLIKNWDEQKTSDGHVTHYSKYCLKIKEPVINKLKEIIEDPYILAEDTYFQRYLPTQGMGAHQDDNKVLKEIELSKKYKDGDRFQTVRKPEYGIVVYLQKSDGGNIFYPKQDIEFVPSPGDLLIHGAQENCTHMVKPLISGERFVIPTMIYTDIKVPF